MKDGRHKYENNKHLLKVLKTGKTLYEMSQLLNMAPGTVIVKLKAHGVMGINENLDSCRKRLGIKTDQENRQELIKKRVFSCFKSIYLSNNKKDTTEELQIRMDKELTRIGFLSEVPITKDKIKRLRYEIVHSFSEKAHSEKGRNEKKEDVVEPDEKVLFKFTPKTRVVSGPKLWTILKEIRKLFPDIYKIDSKPIEDYPIKWPIIAQRLNSTTYKIRKSLNDSDIKINKLKKIHSSHLPLLTERSPLYWVRDYRKSIVDKLSIFCYEGASLKKLENRFGKNFIKICDALDIDYKSICKINMIKRIEEYEASNYDIHMICQELKISQTEIDTILNYQHI